MSKGSVVGVVGFAAEIPCELTPKTATDEPTLILWYKDIFGTPIYRSEASLHCPWLQLQSLIDLSAMRNEEVLVRSLSEFVKFRNFRFQSGVYRFLVYLSLLSSTYSAAQ